jgi:hypothetical protein
LGFLHDHAATHQDGSKRLQSLGQGIFGFE